MELQGKLTALLTIFFVFFYFMNPSPVLTQAAGVRPVPDGAVPFGCDKDVSGGIVECPLSDISKSRLRFAEERVSGLMMQRRGCVRA